MFSTHSAFPTSRGAAAPYYSDSLLQNNAAILHPYIYAGSPQYPNPSVSGAVNPAAVTNGRHSEDRR